MARQVARGSGRSAEAAVECCLRQVLRQIEPTAEQKAGARRSHLHLRELLDSGRIGDRIVDIYLSGSYARDTAIRPLDDVDLIVVVDPRNWKTDWLSSLPAPARIIDSFASAIRRRYPQSSVFKQRRSVRLQLAHINIDVVPAVGQRGNGRVQIPDRDSGEWIVTAPAVHSDAASRVNSARSGLFKPLVKLAKLWSSRLPDSARAKSFTIETIATRVFSKTSFVSVSEGLLLFWDYLASRFHAATVQKWHHDFGMSFSWWDVSVPDIAETGSNTAAYMDRSHAVALSKHARLSRDHLLAAEFTRTQETLEERVWRSLRIF